MHCRGYLMSPGYCTPAGSSNCQTYPVVAGEIGTNFKVGNWTVCQGLQPYGCIKPASCIGSYHLLTDAVPVLSQGLRKQLCCCSLAAIASIGLEALPVLICNHTVACMRRLHWMSSTTMTWQLSLRSSPQPTHTSQSASTTGSGGRTMQTVVTLVAWWRMTGEAT